jgi:hypothetical protein
VNEQGFELYELAHELEAETAGVPIEEAMLVTHDFMEDLKEEQNPVWKNEVHRNLGTPAGRHYLTVVGNKVVAVIMPRFCGAYSRAGDRILALSGERVPVGAGHSFTMLPLVKLAGNAAAQWDQFSFVTKRAKPLEEIVASAEGGNLDLEQELPPGEEEVTTVKMLAVHAKIAAVFTRGVEVKRAAVLIRRMQVLVPPQYQDRCQALVEFGRVAVINNGADVSVCETTWARTNWTASVALERWYHELVQAAVPAWVRGGNGPRNQEVAPAAQPQGGNEVGVLAAAIQQMSATQAASAAATSERVKSRSPFMPAETRKILMAMYPPEQLDGLGTESLSPFWTKLVEYRGSVGKTRIFVQEQTKEFTARTPAGMQDFFWSPQLLATLRDLTFGGDKGGSYKFRMQGLSVFAWAPFSDSQSSLLNERMATAMRLESNQERHRDEDARALLQLSGNGEALPTTRYQVMLYVEHDIRMLEMLFGNQCLALRHCDDILALLKTKAYFFQRYGPTHWAGLLWDYHLARLEATDGEGTASLDYLVQRMNQRVLPDLDRFAEDVKTAIWQAAGVSDSSKRGREEERGGGGGDRSGKKSRSDEWLLHHTWAADVVNTKAAIAPKKLTGKALFPSQEISRKVYGESFRSLLGGKAPCDRWFILGECSWGSSCRFAHGGTAKPSDKVVTGLHERLKTRLAEVVDEQKN